MDIKKIKSKGKYLGGMDRNFDPYGEFEKWKYRGKSYWVKGTFIKEIHETPVDTPIEME
jgi:hypothetical protein